MNLGDLSASASSDSKRRIEGDSNSENMEAPIYHQPYPQHTSPFGTWDDAANHHHFVDNNLNSMWMGNIPMSTYDTTTMFQPTTSNHNFWPTYASLTPSGIDGPTPSTVGSSPSLGAQGQAWPQMSKDITGWEQPLPSPTSETPPYSQYAFHHQSTPSDNGLGSAVPKSTTDFATPPQQPQAAPNSKNTGPKAKNKGKGKVPTLKPAKKSEPSSPKARVIKRKSPSPSRSLAGAKSTPHIGIFPPNVDPKKASEKIQREAWEKAKTEALAMSQRRLMLLDHERGALERETQKLQVNIGLMRETVARQHSELQEAISKAERLNRQF